MDEYRDDEVLHFATMDCLYPIESTKQNEIRYDLVKLEIIEKFILLE